MRRVIGCAKYRDLADKRTEVLYVFFCEGHVSVTCKFNSDIVLSLRRAREPLDVPVQSASSLTRADVRKQTACAEASSGHLEAPPFIVGPWEGWRVLCTAHPLMRGCLLNRAAFPLRTVLL
jgi:hypothetical protein